MDNEKKLTTEQTASDAAELEATEMPEAEPLGDAAPAVEPLEDEATDLEPTEDEAVADPPRFTAKTTLNAAVQLEASKALAPKIGSVTGIVGIALMAVLLGISLWQYFTTFATDRLVMAGVLVLVIAFLIYSRLTAPKKALKRWESGMRRSYGTDALHLTTEFFDHSLAQSVEECDDLIVEGYSKISELRETELLLLLRCSARQWFFVDKSGFTVGDAEQCKDFLRDRIGR